MNHPKEILYLGRFASTFLALFFVVNISFSSFSITQILLLSNNNRYKAYASSSDFNFAAAGDCGCGRYSADAEDQHEPGEDIVNGIVNKNPELVLGLGDFSYEETADCWFEMIAPLDDKMKITIGNHDNETTELLDQYMSHFNLTKQFYSFEYQNVHFTVISTELPSNGSEEIEQYEFVDADLRSAASDMDHFGLILSSISKSQEIQKWASGREGVKQSDISILLDVFPRLKLYEELVEGMIRRQQQSIEFVRAKA